jgi:hypothetical protein
MITITTLKPLANLKRRVLGMAAVAVIGAAAAAGAHAVAFTFDHDAADLVHARASFVLAGMDWGQEVGGSQVSGRLGGQLTYHGVVAGCARIRVIWRNADGQEIAGDYSGQACSNSSAPSFPVGVTETYASGSLRKARIELQLKEFNASSFQTVASRNMIAGGN